ncbi:cuticle collagen 2-like [Melopsittacus undulatus]|uniref:cuticle collagen 2-like n=1 Tax=Melopsittacus undulatus TaxID=13146 RepID=UPI00146F01A2|nr:cuticle collagen 2-like [Melopsittacus undulatus]
MGGLKYGHSEVRCCSAGFAESGCPGGTLRALQGREQRSGGQGVEQPVLRPAPRAGDCSGEAVGTRGGRFPPACRSGGPGTDSLPSGGGTAWDWKAPDAPLPCRPPCGPLPRRCTREGGPGLPCRPAALRAAPAPSAPKRGCSGETRCRGNPSGDAGRYAAPRPRPLPLGVWGARSALGKDMSPTSALPSAVSAPGRESDTH